MPDESIGFTVEVPIREIDAADVRAAFAEAHGWTPMVAQGEIEVPNPVTIEEFITQRCTAFLLEVTKMHLIQTEEAAARQAATIAAAERAAEVTEWFDTRRLEAIGGEGAFTHFPTVNDRNLAATSGVALPIILSGTDPDGLALTYTIAAQPLHGTLTGAGAEWVYTASSEEDVADNFFFRATNGVKQSPMGTVVIAVTGVPQNG